MGKEEVKSLETLDLLDFSGGLNSNPLSADVAENEWTSLNNIVYYNGSLQVIPGFIRDSFQIGGSDSTTSITGIYDYQQRDSTQYLVVTTADNIYYKNTVTNQPTSIKGSLTVTDVQHSMITWNDRLLGTDGANKIWTWDGSGNAVTLTSLCSTDVPPASAKSISTFNDRAVLLNYIDTRGNSHPCRAAFSDIDNPLAWSELNQYWELETDDSQEIVTGKQLGEKFIIYKTNSIGYVTGYGTQSWTVNRAWRTSVGCVAGSTVQTSYLEQEGTLIEVHIFLSPEGLKALDESGTIYSLPLPKENKDYPCSEYFDTLDKANLKYAVSTFYRKRNWYLSFYRASGSSSNDHGCIYISQSNSLWTLSDITANAAAQVYNSTTGEYEVYIGSEDGILYRLSETTKGIESTTELIANGSMETGTGPTSWTDYSTPTTSERSSTVAFQGTYSNKLITNAINEGTYQAITTEVGKRYRVYAYAYVAASSDCILIKADSDASNVVTGTALTTATTWTRLTLTFTATSTTTHIIVKSYSEAASTIYLDDVSCRCIETDSYAVSKYYDLGSEQIVKFLRSFVPSCSATDSGGITFTLEYDKGPSTSTSDILTLTSKVIDWTAAINWLTAIDWTSYEELTYLLEDLTKESFRTIRYKISNNTGNSDFKYNKLLLTIKLLQKRWFNAA